MTLSAIKPLIGPNTQLCMSLAARPGTFGTRFHNRLYDQLGLDFIYKAFTTTDLPAAIGGIRALAFAAVPFPCLQGGGHSVARPAGGIGGHHRQRHTSSMMAAI